MTRYRDGEARFRGVADDYAFVVMGLIELYQATFEAKYLTRAYELNQILVDDFFEDGALYQTGKGGEMLISRPRDLYDGALPSYNSVSISNFARLSSLCDDGELLHKAQDIIRFFGTDLEQAPVHFGFALCGILLLSGPTKHMVLSGDETAEMVSVINSTYQPFATVALADKTLAQHLEFYKNYETSQGKTAVYLCVGTHCEPPIYSADQLRQRLDQSEG